MMQQRVEREALGRMASIGDLYDVRNDSFCGVSMFSETKFPASAVKVSDNPSTKIDMIKINAINDRFSKFGVGADLQLSILSNFWPLEGSGKFFKEESQSARSLVITLMHKMTTKVEQLRLNYKNMRSHINNANLANTNATHVVTEIKWGANSFISFTYSCQSSAEKTQIESMCRAEFEKFASVGGGIESKATMLDLMQLTNLQVDADVLPIDVTLPTTFFEAVTFIKNMPAFLKAANDGKGKPVMYTLQALNDFPQVMHILTEKNKATRVEEFITNQCVGALNRVTKLKQQVQDFSADVQVHAHCLSQREGKAVNALMKGVAAAEIEFKDDLKEFILAVRHGWENESVVQSLLENDAATIKALTKRLHSGLRVQQIREKVKFARECEQKEIMFIGRNGQAMLSDVIAGSHEVYVLYASVHRKNKHREEWMQHYSSFNELVNRNAKKPKAARLQLV